MPRSQKRATKPHEEHSHLTIRLERYDACAAAGVNRYAYDPQYAWDLDDDDPLYEFTNQVSLTGISTYPPERQGDNYDVVIYGTDSPSHRLSAKLKDVHARDTHFSPQYREYRGKRLPVYVPPEGLGRIEKIRGESRWQTWLFVTPRFVNDLLVILGQQRTLFLSLHEFKVDRSRWVRAMSLQTNDPAEE